MIKFRYHGEAVGKGRPRVRIIKKGKQAFPQLYTPKETKEFEEAIRFEFFAGNCDGWPVYERGTPLKATVLIGCSIPKSYTKKKQALCRDRVLVPDKKPDLDNILKSIFDALNGYAFEDDSQIVEIFAEKQYAVEPFVEVEIDELR